MKIKFSVIIPLYNAERYIEECLNSILKQSYDSYEIIIVNDGSEDNSLKIIEERFGYNDKIKIINQKNSGVSVARNRGLEECKGDWVIFLDADDWIEYNALLKIKKIIEKNKKIDLFITDCIIDGDNLLKQDHICSKFELYESIISINYSRFKYNNKYLNNRCIGGKIFKRELLINNNILFIKNLSSFEDGIFNLIAIKSSNYIMFSKLKFYNYRKVNDSVTHTYSLKSIENLKVINNEIEKFSLSVPEFDLSYSIAYFYLDEYRIILNNISKIYQIKDIKEGIKILSSNYELIVKNKINKINIKKASKKERIIFKLIRYKLFVILYFIYYFKKK